MAVFFDPVLNAVVSLHASLASSASLLTLSDDGTNQTLTGNIGKLIISPASTNPVQITNALLVNPTNQAKMTVIGDLASSGFSSVATDALDKLVAVNRVSATSGATRGFAAINEWFGSSSSSAKIMGFNAFAYHSSSSPLTASTLAGGLIGGRMGARFFTGGTGTVTMATGLGIANQSVGTAGVTVTTMHGLIVEGPSMANVTIGTNYGFKIDDYNPAPTACTTNYALFISTRTHGSTKWGLYVNGDPSYFGSTVSFVGNAYPNTNGGASCGQNNNGWSDLWMKDASAAFENQVTFNSSTALTADRNLILDVVDGARTVKIQGNPVLDNWFDQSVKTTAAPQFARIGLGVAADGTIQLTFNAGATAPSTTIGVTAVNRYGGDTNYLGDPNAWVAVRVAGANYKVPLYT